MVQPFIPIWISDVDHTTWRPEIISSLNWTLAKTVLHIRICTICTKNLYIKMSRLAVKCPKIECCRTRRFLVSEI